MPTQVAHLGTLKEVQGAESSWTQDFAFRVLWKIGIITWKLIMLIGLEYFQVNIWQNNECLKSLKNFGQNFLSKKGPQMPLQYEIDVEKCFSDESSDYQRMPYFFFYQLPTLPW